MDHTRLNLRNITSLIVDSDNYTRGLIVQMLRGFGMYPPMEAGTGQEARDILKHQCPDLCIVEAVLPDMTSADLLRWIRKLKGPVRFMPVIVATGYTQMRMIASARDGGANIVVKKPISPKALFDHMLWIARTARPFIESDDYVGPDRRFKSTMPPDGKFKRELDDPEAAIDAVDETAGPDRQTSKLSQLSDWALP